MKTYLRTYDVYRKIAEEGEKRFTRKKDNRVYYWDEYKRELLPENKTVGGYKVIELDELWEEVKEPISFTEVLKTTKENKGILITIKNPEYDIYYEKWPLDSLLNELSEHLATDKLAEILLMSEFYID